MKRGQKIAIAVTTCALILAGVLAIALLQPRTEEPLYNGHRLSEWLHPTPNNPYWDAPIRHLGTNALPILLQWINDEPPRWRISLAFWCATHGQARIYRAILGTHLRKAGLAITGFKVLGTNAYPAVPDLLRLLGSKSPFVSHSAFYALEGLPAEKLVIIAESLTNSDATVRASAALYSNTIHGVAPQPFPSPLFCKKGFTDSSHPPSTPPPISQMDPRSAPARP